MSPELPVPELLLADASAMGVNGKIDKRSIRNHPLKYKMEISFL